MQTTTLVQTCQMSQTKVALPSAARLTRMATRPIFRHATTTALLATLRPYSAVVCSSSASQCKQQTTSNSSSTSSSTQPTTAAATTTLAVILSLGAGAVLPFPAAAALAQPLAELSEGLETPVQLIYLAALLGFLVVGAFLVVRQVLIRRELEEAAKVLGERVRTGEATSEDSFELGVILLRKKLFTQATKNLEKAKKGWQGEEEELAQVHNALGYAYFNMERVDEAVAEYKAAVGLQPGYVTAWNNLGDAYERLKQYGPALDAYREALSYAPDNKVAQSRADFCKTRLERTGML
jgi:tetratricopeptide (TPR) repeat protein